MYQCTYYVDKTSGTFADALLAFGTAYVLREMLCQMRGDEAEVHLAEAGDAYALQLSAAVEPEWLEQCQHFSGAPFLLTPKNRAKLPNDLPIGTPMVVDYQAEKERRAEYLALVQGLSAEAKRARQERKDHAELAALVGKGVHEHWNIFRALNPGALDAYNSVVAQWWEARHAFPDLLRIILQLFARSPNDLQEAEGAWAAACKVCGLSKPREATAAQVFNPAQGKGQNRTKPDSVAPGNLKGFWLPEYLKAVGLYQAGLTHIVANPRDPANAKDRKTYVLAPRDVDLGVHQKIMRRFREAMVRSETAVKLDALAALRYARSFLEHVEESHEATTEEVFFGKRPGDLIAGLQMAFYKNLGNSSATMNIAVINLPTWVRAGPLTEIKRFKAVLQEHEQVLRALDETRSDAYELLALYRDFLSANDLRPFFKFTTAFSGYYMGQRERGRWCPAFTTSGLEVLFMNTDRKLAGIVASEGFRNVAYAIRYSTVIPQARKARGQPTLYQIRYGLGQQLARKANYAAEFVAELSEFLQQYNAETEQVYERTGQRLRKGVRTSDIDEIVALVDEHGPRVVCDLLVAYGYARTPQMEEKDQGEEGEETTDLPADDETEAPEE